MIFRNKLRHPFEKRLLEIRSRIKPEPFEWYRFDTFANLSHFEALLPGGLDALVRLAGDEPVADIGAGDGDVSFLFESLGCAVTVIDWPGTNANQMRGVNLMKRELGSSVAIREVDIDGQFRLDGERYGLALCLGLLYHLKNPFYFLEQLAVHSRYCLLSTRILPRGQTADPVAWLTGDREFENDPTNYWFFSEAGMMRLLDRCGWDVTRTNITGDGRDDRFFCLAESRVAKNTPVIRLLNGWHEQENGAWRWTHREFAAIIENVIGATVFELRFRIEPPRVVTVRAEVNGAILPERRYETAGEHVYREAIEAAGRQNRIRVRLTGSFESDGRELGVIIRLPGSTIIDEECGLRLLLPA